ncbi:alpha/beta hydrolase [Rhodobacteraceae bacterium NNCM2]|nr:alpha/beta hydrolase [Coraliihabitans acroporae]
MTTNPFDPAAISTETAAFNARLAETLKDVPLPMEVPPEVSRKARAEGKGLFPLAGPLDGSEWVSIPGAAGGPGRVRLTLPEGAPRGVYLHIHGGGWTLGDPEHLDGYNQRIARATGLAVASVHYRLSPENRWPGCAEDCEAAARWALNEFGGPMMIGGESAGGHLSAVTLLRLRAAGLSGRVKGMVLNYGMYDLDLTPSMRNWGAEYLVLSTPVVQWFAENLMGGQRDPEASPLYADLTGLPPALFQVGTSDPLLDDSLFMAARWRAAGNRAELAVVPGGVHAYDCFDLEIARQSHARQDAFLNELLG